MILTLIIPRMTGGDLDVHQYCISIIERARFKGWIRTATGLHYKRAGCEMESEGLAGTGCIEGQELEMID